MSDLPEDYPINVLEQLALLDAIEEGVLHTYLEKVYNGIFPKHIKDILEDISLFGPPVFAEPDLYFLPSGGEEWYLATYFAVPGGMSSDLVQQKGRKRHLH